MSRDARTGDDVRPDVLKLSGVGRAFGELVVLENVELVLRPGEILGLIGPSGSGKSTLLHIAGLLEPPTEGNVFVDGIDTSAATDAQRTAIRLQKIGFVYQFHHLLPEFVALRNVAIPMMLSGVREREAEARATSLLQAMGLGERLTHQPAELSGGEKQRVAIARALANQPRLLLADEPTGNLDQETSGAVFEALTARVREQNLAAIIATHDRSLAAKMDRVLRIENRQLVEVAPPTVNVS